MAPDDFLNRVRAFLERHPELSPSRVGDAALGDPNLIKDLLGNRRRAGGRQPRLDTAQRLLEWFSAYERDPVGVTAAHDAVRRRRRLARQAKPIPAAPAA